MCILINAEIGCLIGKYHLLDTLYYASEISVSHFCAQFSLGLNRQSLKWDDLMPESPFVHWAVLESLDMITSGFEN